MIGVSSERFGWRQLGVELSAGLTVALVSLPQCLAYAMMSGLPAEYGLVTAAIPGLVAAILGYSAQIITGPTNTTGLLILRTLAPYLAVNGLIGPAGLPVLATLTLMVGLIRGALAWLGGATLLRFIPESVLVGFTSGAAVLIALMQLDEALGLSPSAGHGALSQLVAVYEGLVAGQLKLGALALTTVTVALMTLGKRFSPKLPVALLTIVALTGLAWALGWSPQTHGIALVHDRSAMPSGWPMMALPVWDVALFGQLLLPALAIVLLGTLELTVSVRADEQEQRMRQEILAQGMANVVGAFVGAFPASASLTRSALLRLGQAKTKLAGISAALVLLPIIFFAADAVGYIPQPALAGVLWVTAWSMIKRDRIARIYKAALASRALLLLTFGATLILPLEWAIFVGVGAGLGVHLRQDGVTRQRLWRFDASARSWSLIEPDSSLAWAREDRLVIEISGSFHYAAVQHFREELVAQLPSVPATVILDLSYAHHMRFAAVLALEQLSALLKQRDQRLIVCGVDDDFAQILEKTGAAIDYERQQLEPSRSALAAKARGAAAQDQASS